MSTLGARVRSLRKARGLSQVQLATLIGVRQPSLSEIENGRTETVSAGVLNGLVTVLKTTNAWLLQGEGPCESEEILPLLHRIIELQPKLSQQAMQLGRSLDSITDPRQRTIAYRAASAAIESTRSGKA